MIGIEYSPYQEKYFLTFGDTLRSYFRELNSYSIIPARLLNVSYASYLRFACAQYNGILIGKSGYPIVYFSNEKDAKALVKFLSQYWYKGIKKI